MYWIYTSISPFERKKKEWNSSTDKERKDLGHWISGLSLPTSLDLLQEQREALRNYFSMPLEEILHSDALTAMLKRSSLLWLNTSLTYAKESSSENKHPGWLSSSEAPWEQEVRSILPKPLSLLLLKRLLTTLVRKYSLNMGFYLICSPLLTNWVRISRNLQLRWMQESLPLTGSTTPQGTTVELFGRDFIDHSFSLISLTD